MVLYHLVRNNYFQSKMEPSIFVNRQNNAEATTPTDCFVSGAFAAVLRVARFVGVSPLRFVKKDTGWRISLSQRWSIYGYFTVTITIITTIATLISDLKVDQDKSVRMRTNTRRVVWIVDASLMMLIAGVAVFGAPGQMKTMIACLNHVQKIKYELNFSLWPIHSERRKICVFILWVVATVTVTCTDQVMLTLTTNYINTKTWISVLYSFYFYCYWILQMREMLFIVITRHVKCTFITINNSLRNLLHDSITRRPYLHHESVRHLALKYSSACDVVREVNQCHGLMLLMMLGSFLLHLVATAYYLLNDLIDDTISHNMATHVGNIVVQLCWCVYHVANLLMVIEPCHLTHLEMETTRMLVSHLMRCTNSIYDPLAVELELFFKHLILNEASYSPMQVTKMSRSLLATILGSITTYLILIVQL